MARIAEELSDDFSDRPFPVEAVAQFSVRVSTAKAGAFLSPSQRSGCFEDPAAASASLCGHGIGFRM